MRTLIESDCKTYEGKCTCTGDRCAERPEAHLECYPLRILRSILMAIRNQPYIFRPTIPFALSSKVLNGMSVLGVVVGCILTATAIDPRTQQLNKTRSPEVANPILNKEYEWRLSLQTMFYLCRSSPSDDLKHCERLFSSCRGG